MAGYVYFGSGFFCLLMFSLFALSIIWYSSEFVQSVISLKRLDAKDIQILAPFSKIILLAVKM
nr:MAG TPA: hypothetical protein [Caudoviricetes sp.]